MGLGEDVVIEMSVASGEAMGGREGLLMGDDCLGGNEGGASSTSVTSLFGDTDLTMWEKQTKELIGFFYFSFLITSSTMVYSTIVDIIDQIYWLFLFGTRPTF